MSTDGRLDIAASPRTGLGIELMPWQVQVLERAGRKTGIRTMNAVLDELRMTALWLTPELSEVYRVAAKYLP